MAILQPIHNIAEICAKKGIENAILCPGSRSAALTISFVRHPKIKTYSISDERSAAFIAMGMAQITKKPVVIVCTSGTAAYNFASAIAESFFQEIPLIILTADRPDEWIHQYDGQTIFQREIYGKHVKKSYHLPSDYTHADSIWQIERSLNEGINLSTSKPKGPVHFNVPIREPFYPAENEQVTFDRHVRLISKPTTKPTLNEETWQEIFDIWEKSERKLIAIGQSTDIDTQNLKNLSEEFFVPILGDVISNVHKESTDFILAHDVFLSANNDDSLQPDLLITAGMSFISKNLKIYLRNFQPKYHIHLQEHPDLIDPFQTLTHKLEVSPNYFFHKLFEDLDYQKFREGDEEDETQFYEDWKKIDIRAKKKLSDFLSNAEFSDFKALEIVLNNLPENSILHLGNSMSVRYANLVGLNSSKNIEVFCNRGTSGIEGSLSSAVGQAMMTDKIVTCVLGDVSFMYDRNALWNNYLPSNLRIVVMNNHGGNIFRMIDGPSKQPELRDYFETNQKENCDLVAKQAGIGYAICKNIDELSSDIKRLFGEQSQPFLLEIETDPVQNKEVFLKYKQSMAEL